MGTMDILFTTRLITGQINTIPIFLATAQHALQ